VFSLINLLVGPFRTPQAERREERRAAVCVLIRADVAATRSHARRETVISDATSPSTATPVETVYPRGHGKIDDPLRAVTIGPPRAGTPIISLRAPAPSYPSHVRPDST
jgi:hypothetical protein